MDIYRFINSNAIREHLKQIDYQFNSLEAAWLIYQCMGMTMEEKHAAWEKLIAEMPDCEVEDRRGCSYSGSLHEMLRKYIQIQKKTYELFINPESTAVYQYKFYCKNDCGWCEDYTEVFATEQECWDEIEEDLDLGIERICIQKRYIGKRNTLITVDFNESKQVMDVYAVRLHTDEECKVLEAFEDQWFVFPVPFEKGDIVYQKRLPGPWGDVAESGAFVLKGVVSWDSEKDKNKFIEEHGDNSDMNAWGYFQDPDGRIFYEVMHNYMDLEYYDQPLEGRMRLFKAISNFMKGEIGLDMLLTAYRKVIVDEFADDVMLHHWYADYVLELAGLSDVVEQKRKVGLND